MEKFRNTDIRPFHFSDLQSTHVVSGNQFKPFEFQALNGEVVDSAAPSQEEIRTERKFAEKNNFKIDDTVSAYRGLSKQEQNDLEKRIQQDVDLRLEAAYQKAYDEGLEKGREEGKQLALQEYHEALEQKIENFSQIISQIPAQTDRIVHNHRSEIYEFIKRFSKWIILKEINQKVYLEGLLEKLILELNARKNLIVKVGRNNFSEMPEVLKIVEGRLGQLTNVRIEIVPEIQHPGIILESENGLIDGSIEGVFQNIDKIFEQVVGHE
jgi:flagellar assembly protein FliH